MQKSQSTSVGIVGAGISALTAAHVLARAGFRPHIFEKSRGPGGRMATRREGDYAFDHGAQYFTARDPRFVEKVKTWAACGLVEVWNGRIGSLEKGVFRLQQQSPERFVGVPSMSAIGRHLAEPLSITYGQRVESLRRTQSGWQLSGAELAFACDVVVVSAPPQQALDLLPENSPLAAAVAEVRLLPCWALMAVFETPLDLPFDGAFVGDSVLSWVARNSSKARRGAHECWVLHTSTSWSERHLEQPSDAVAEQLLDAFFTATDTTPRAPLFAKAHRWRYSIAENPLERGHLWDGEKRLGICGDWCHTSRVEGAFLSGLTLAEHIVAAFNGEIQ
jgi:renalase